MSISVIYRPAEVTRSTSPSGTASCCAAVVACGSPARRETGLTGRTTPGRRAGLQLVASPCFAF